MKAHVVIGANYGDEGKGLMTDYLADTLKAKWVVRFNGGAQAGHTVETPAGKRHVFSHFSAGTFAGAHTFLGREFVCNPILYRKEERILRRAHGLRPRVMVHQDAQVTTHLDMMLNQVVETIRARDGKQHGSCGVGFGETIERAQYPDFASPVRVLRRHRGAFEQHLKKLIHEWVPMRAAQLGIEDDPLLKESMAVATHPDLLNASIEDTLYFLEDAWCTRDAGLLRGHEVVFEGAQGLALDMQRGDFPHVTRSNTGIKNVLPIAEEVGIDELDVIYATRWFLTRHGAGPLPGRVLGYFNTVDRTNVPHPYQGELRCGRFDDDTLLAMKGRIDADLGDWLGDAAPDWTAKLAVTWLDHVPLAEEPIAATRMATAVGLPLGYRAYGPTRANVWPYTGA
jgi:adenylosuccinate synthase